MTTTEPKHLLVPVDLSDASRVGLAVAHDLARRLDARLSVLFVKEPWVDPDRDAVERFVRDVLGKVNRATVEMVEAPFIAEAVVRFASGHDVDWICMTTAGRRGWRRFFLGSVTAEVVRHSEVPVLTFRDRGAEKPDYVFDDFRRVMVAMDLSEASSRLLDIGIHLGGPHGNVLLVHVVESMPEVELYGKPLRLPAEDVRAAEDWARRSLERYGEAIDPQRLAGVEVAVGRPAKRILMLEEELLPDVTVVGTHGRTGWERLTLGSVAERVVQYARGPVLVVPTLEQNS